MEVTAEALPPSIFDLQGVGKYRDAVCQHLGLFLKRVGGNGNCFFVSCSSLLSTLGLQVSATNLRLQVVDFFRECKEGSHGLLGERCMVDIGYETSEALVSSSTRYNGRIPESVEFYLNASTDNCVWVAGYHWIRAVAHLYSVCVVVVIHGFQFVECFGNSSSPRIHLYKRDVETHYDMLVRVAVPNDQDDVDDGEHAGSSESSERATLSHSTPSVSSAKAEYGVVYTPHPPATRHRRAFLQQHVEEFRSFQMSLSAGYSMISVIDSCAKLQYTLDAFYSQPETRVEWALRIREELVSLNAPQALIVQVSSSSSEVDCLTFEAPILAPISSLSRASGMRNSRAKFAQSSSVDAHVQPQLRMRPRKVTSVSLGTSSEDEDAVTASLSRRRSALRATAKVAAKKHSGADAAALPSNVVKVEPGMILVGASQKECKERFLNLLNEGTGHHVRCINSRTNEQTGAGYMYFKCKNCEAACGVSTCKKLGGWKVTSCTDVQYETCQPNAATVSELPTSVCQSSSVSRSQLPVPQPPLADACCICGVRETTAIYCVARHAYCEDCFDHHVDIVCTGEDKTSFIASGCVMKCSLCSKGGDSEHFDMRVSTPHLSDGTYKKYLLALSEKNVVEATLQFQSRIEAMRKQNRRDIAKANGDEDAAVIGVALIFHQLTVPLTKLQMNAASISPWRLYIPGAQMQHAENCWRTLTDVVVWCVTALLKVLKANKVAVPTFVDGALKFAAIRKNATRMCAFVLSTPRSMCYRILNRLCAPHSFFRPVSGNQKPVYPPQPHPDVWWTVMHEAARKRVKQYIKEQVPERIHERVHTKIQKEFPKLRLPDFGTVVTDGFRLPTPVHPPKAPGFEENISLLMSMSLANRTRAIQVLEFLQNDIAAAIEFLLAERGMN
jgi:hypothetical protein